MVCWSRKTRAGPRHHVGRMELELHQVEKRYAGLRRRDARSERALVASLAESGQQTPVVVVRGEGGRHVLVDGVIGHPDLREAGRGSTDGCSTT